MRNTYGQTNLQIRSRFLDEIPQSMLIEQPAAYWTMYSLKNYFTQWIKGNTIKLASQDRVQLFSSYQPSTPPATKKTLLSDRIKNKIANTI